LPGKKRGVFGNAMLMDKVTKKAFMECCVNRPQND